MSACLLGRMPVKLGQTNKQLAIYNVGTHEEVRLEHAKAAAKTARGVRFLD